jgi:putative acetyltransferase
MEHRFRWAEPRDFAMLADIMFDAVRNGPSEYSERQRTAWVPAPRRGAEWNQRLAAQDVIIGEYEDEALGFMSLCRNGYVDFAYIRPAAQGTGLFRQMFRQIEERASLLGIELLWVHASLAARPAFAAVGFTVRKREVVEIGGERLERFEMEKTLRLREKRAARGSEPPPQYS